jgi:hypothetical protein
MRIYVSILLLCLALSGCAAPLALPAGLTPASQPAGAVLHGTQVTLAKANYRVVRTGVRGESRGLVLLLFFNVIPASHQLAWERLYQEAGLEPGGPWALANVVQEQERRSFLLFGLPRVRVRADVVEFAPGP